MPSAQDRDVPTSPLQSRTGQVRYAPRRLGHVNLFVRDMPTTMDFLTRHCGFEETARETPSGTGFVSNGNTHHDVGVADLAGYARLTAGRPAWTLGPAHRGTRPGLNHLGWEMESEARLVEAYRRAVAAGLQPRLSDAATSRSNYLFDPQGLQHQFYADMERDWRRIYTGGEAVLHSNPPWNPDARPPSPTPLFDPAPQIRRVEAAPLHPWRVTHVVLAVQDLQQALQFHTETAGLEMRSSAAEIDAGVIRLGGAASEYAVALYQASAAPDPLHHAAFELDPRDDVDAAARRLRALGVEVLDVRHWSHKSSVFIADPDGIRLEFYVRLSPLLAFDLATLATLDERVLAA